MVEYYDEEKDMIFVFLTNNFEVTSLEIARLYRNRRQIEIFISWIKQTLTTKTLWSHSENVVNIYTWIAICTFS